MTTIPEIFEYRHTVRADEIDQLGRANNIVYVEWMQAAAIAHSAALGWPLEAYLKREAGWVVRSHTIEYNHPARKGDRIVIRTWVASMELITSLRRYRIVRAGDDEVLATAETKWAFIDFKTGRPERIPPDIAGAFTVVSR